MLGFHFSRRGRSFSLGFWSPITVVLVAVFSTTRWVDASIIVDKLNVNGNAAGDAFTTSLFNVNLSPGQPTYSFQASASGSGSGSVPQYSTTWGEAGSYDFTLAAEVGAGGQQLVLQSSATGAYSINMSASLPSVATAQATGHANMFANLSLSRPVRYLASYYADDGTSLSLGADVNYAARFNPLPNSSLNTSGSGTYSGILMNNAGDSAFLSLGTGTNSGELFSKASAQTKSNSVSTSLTLSMQELPPMHLFGVGVDWTTTSNPLKNLANGYLGAQALSQALSTTPIFDAATSQTINLNATDGGTNNKQIVNSAFNTFRQTVAPGDTVVLYFSSHGKGNDSANEGNSLYFGPGLQLSQNGDGTQLDDNPLTPNDIASEIDQLPISSRKIVIIDGCETGGFGTSLETLPNTAILTATDALSSTAILQDHYGIFTHLLDQYISQNQEITLEGLKTDIVGSDLYSNEIGQSLPLLLDGFAPYEGTAPSLYESNDFSGDLLGPAISVPEPASCVIAFAFVLSWPNRCRRWRPETVAKSQV